MAKAEKFHTEGRTETYSLLEDMIKKHHGGFVKTEILILMKHGGWKSKGKEVFGKFKVLGDDLRSTWAKDAILYLNADMWNKMSDPQRRYVLDHALFSLDTKKDKHGKTMEAIDGRPLLKTLPPDIEAYFDVIKRHGTATEDVKRLALAIKEVNPDQLTFEDVAGGKKQQGGEDPKPPGNGLAVKQNPDGSVDAVDDPNQTKLEDYEDDGSGGEGGPIIPEGNPDDLPF